MPKATVTLPKLDALQIERILDRLVPLIAEQEDHEFFRGVLQVKAENSSSAEFSAFVAKMLNS